LPVLFYLVFRGKQPLLGSHLFNAFAANNAAAVMFNIIGISAKDASRFILFKDDFFGVNVDFQGIFYFNP